MGIVGALRIHLRLAARNVRRNRLRTAITLAAIAAGVAGLILAGGFVQDIFVQLGERLIRSQSGHLQVAKSGYRAEGSRRPDAYLLDDLEGLRARILAIPGVTDAMARVSFAGLLNNGRTDVAVIAEGVEPDREAGLGTYVRIVAGRRLAAGDRSGAMIGKGLADALQLRPGDPATLLVATAAGAANTLDVEIVGVFQTFSRDYDARAVQVPLAAAQAALDHRSANVLAVSLARTHDTAAIANALRAMPANAGLEVETWERLNDFYEKTVELYQRQFGVLQAIILVMVLLGVANTVNATVLERTGEFGTMRAMGDPGSRVMALILAEALLLGLIGSAAGIALGVLLALALSAVGIPMPPPPNADLAYVATIRVVPWIAISAPLFATAAAVLAAVAPAWRVARMPIVDALARNV